MSTLINRSVRVDSQLCQGNLIKTWNDSDSTVLLKNSSSGLKAYIKLNKIFQEVRGECIEGIPNKVKTAPEQYPEFFNDTWIKVIKLSNGQFKLVVSSRLRGGMNEPPRAAPRQPPDGRQRLPRLNREVLQLLREVIPHAQRAAGKDVVAFIGPTGVGKSTMVNHLLGKRMVRRPAEMRDGVRLPRNRVEVADGEVEAAPIGHGRSVSHTLYAQTHEIPALPNQAIVDCGGFLDTRGVPTEIAVVTSVKLTLEAASSVKLAICCDYGRVMGPRAVGLTELVRTVLEGLLINYQAANSVLFLITRPTPDEAGDWPTARTVIDHIQQIILEIRAVSPERARIYEFIIRDNGRYVLMYDPLNDESKRQVFDLLRGMQSIQDTRNAFNPAYSAHAAVALLEEVVAIAVIGNNLFRSYFINRQAYGQCALEIRELNGRIERIRANIAALGQANADPAAILAAEEGLRAENDAIVQQVGRDILRLQREIEERNVSIAALNERLALMDRQGEEVESYWTDGIDQEGINIESVTTTTNTVVKKGGYFHRDKTSTDTSTTKTVDKREISRDFNYRGPEIERVVKDPADGNCWSNEERQANSYSIHYETAKGEAAHARIEVFVKKKHFPEQIHLRLGVVQEITAENGRKYDLNNQIREQEGRRHAAQLALSASGNKIERLAEYQRGIEELETIMRQLQARNEELEAERVRLVADIEERRPDFTFLNDYLQLSHDRRLREREAVQEFLRERQRYQLEENNE